MPDLLMARVSGGGDEATVVVADAVLFSSLLSGMVLLGSTTAVSVIEPAALGKPVLIGPHTFNFALVTEQSIEAGGAARVLDADALLAQASALLQDPARLSAMGSRALAFANQHRGATPRTIAAIKPLLPA